MKITHLNKTTDAYYWFPSTELLNLLYKDQSPLHGVPHVLRTWLLAFILSQKYCPQRTDIVTASALFHDTGRKRDFWDKHHGAASAQLIRDYLPLINKDFSSKDVEKIALLCKQHNLEDYPNLPTTLKVLKDADALDRWRLPFFKLDTSYLRLPYSHELIDFSKNLYKQWKYLENRQTNPFLNLKITSQKIHIYKHFPLQLKQQFSKHSNAILTDEIEICENILSQVAKLSKNIKNKSIKNKLKYDDILVLKNALQDFKIKNFSNSFLKAITINLLHNKLYPVLKFIHHDYTFPRRTKTTLQNLFAEVTNKTKTFMYKSDEKIFYKICSLKNTNQIAHLFNALERHLTQYYRFKKLLLLYQLTNTSFPPVLKHLYSPQQSQKKGLLPTLFKPSTKQLTNNPYLWILVVNYYIKTVQIKNLINKGNKQQIDKILDISIDILQTIFRSVDTRINIYTKATKQLHKIIDLAHKYQLPHIINKIQRIWQQELRYINIFPIFENIDIAYYANVFNIYEDNNQHMSRLVSSQLKLFKKITRYKPQNDIDSIIMHYIIPLAVCNFFPGVNHKQLKKFKKIAKSKQTRTHLQKWINILKNSSHSPNTPKYNNIIDYSKKFGRNNSKKILSMLDIPLTTLEKNLELKNYKIIMNIPGISVLKNIARPNGQILSVWNVLGLTEFSQKANLKKLLNCSFKDRISYKDGVQRIMNIRFPNITDLHGVYGSLEKTDILFESDSQNFKEKIPNVIHYPKQIFMKAFYGAITLVFKDNIKKRSIFVFFDSIWKFRQYFVDFKHGAYLKEILSEYLMKISLKTNPFCLGHAYIETIIFGRLTINDVAQIIIPTKIYRKNKDAINKIKNQYPHIQIIKK